MKCVRVGESACTRCQRAKRSCSARLPPYPDEFELVVKTPKNFNAPKQPRTSKDVCRRRFKSRHHNRRIAPANCDGHAVILKHDRRLIDDLPSIYLTAPILAVLGDNVVNDALDIDSHSIYSSATSLSICSSPILSDGNDSPLSRAEMRQLLKIFCSRLLSSIPVFTKDDFKNPDVIIEQQPELIHAICYVTARYLPGGLSTVRLIYPKVLKFVQDKSAGSVWPGTADITSFRALVVLYAFSEIALPNIESPHSPYILPTQLLKTVTEIYGTQLGLHRSIDGARAMLSLPHDQWLSSASYKRYTYWLWLFTMSHHSAIITRTPPSIRSDNSIRSAPELFAGINIEPRMRRLLGEVELCLLWEKANAVDSTFGEWWCPSEQAGPACPSPSAVVDIVTRDLTAWRAKYASFIEHGGFGIGLDFHYRYSQFCLSTYAVCHYTHVSDIDKRDLLVRTTLDHAVGMLSWLQKLSPVVRESLRYISDFAFVMVLYACMFILQACESRHMLSEERCKNLKTVATTAQLLVDLGIHSFHFPSIYGKLLQRQLGNLQPNVCDGVKADLQPKSNSPETPVTIWTEYSNIKGDDWYQDDFGSQGDLFGEMLNLPRLDWFEALE
ncbi:hypothetical protein N5P37_002766 [Trichoderma harzianum]|nr:hypothetical protein N5P37_002766 [Trichoderma harzianum]